MARWTDTNLGPVELYRLGRTVTEVGSRARSAVCVIVGGYRLGRRGQHRGPELCAARALARDVRHDAKVDRGC